MADVSRVQLADGGYVETWYEPNGATTGDPQGVLHVQKHAADGTIVGPDYSHSTLASNYGVYALQGGGFVIGLTVATMDGATLLAEVVDANGALLKTVNGGSSWSLASSPDGGFVVGSISTQHHGFLPPDSRISVYDSQGGLVASPTVSSRTPGPQISVDADGTYHATWTDGGGNAHNLAIDPEHPQTFVAPAAPSSIKFWDDVGTQTGFRVGTNDPTPTIRIAVTEPGWVAIEAAGTTTFGATAAMNPGVFIAVTAEDVARGYKDLDVSLALRASGRTSLADGDYEIGARFENADGIVGALSQSPIHVDTTAPGRPTIISVIDDVGPQQGEVANGSTTDDTRLTFKIALPAGTVTSDQFGMIDRRGDVAWGVTLTQADIDQGYVITTMPTSGGPQHWSAQLLDNVGNLGPQSAAVEFTVDTSTGGRTITSSQYGDTLTGGNGADTLVAGQGPDQLTGQGAADVFSYRALPWNAGHVTDFTVGSDKLDLSALFQASGYTGSDPIRDGYLTLVNNGAGAIVKYDTDGPGSGNTIQYTITTLDHVSASASWAQLTGGGVGGSTVNISPLTVSHAEGDAGFTTYTYTLTRTGDISQGATTSYRVVGSGDHPVDQADLSSGLGGFGTFAWNPGESTRDVVISVRGDQTVESDETFTVELQTPGAGSSNPTVVGLNARATGVVLNDDGAMPRYGTVNISPGTVSHAEGDSGLTSYSFTFTRSGDVSEAASTAYKISGTGANPADAADFATNPGLYTVFFWNPGDTTRTVVIDVAGDTTLESDETFSISLTSGPGSDGTAIGADSSASGLIVNDDSATSNGGRTVTSSQYGDTLTGGAGNDTLVAGQGPDQLTGGGGGDVFSYRQLPWNAGHVTDFTVGSDRLDLSALFQASGYTGTDPIRDGYVTLENNGAGGAIVKFDPDGPASGVTIKTTITTIDHLSSTATWAQLTGGGAGTSANAVVNISPAAVSHAEGNSGSTAYSFTVTRSGDVSQGGTTSYRVVGSGDHPADAADFGVTALGSGTFAWSPGETNHVLTFNVAGDATQESDETFQVVLFTPGGGNSNPTPVGPNSTATGVIVNDDSATPPPSSDGRVIYSQREGDTLTGGAGNDTLNAGRGQDVLTGGGGGDVFAYHDLPWNAGRITDFTVGSDRIDLSALFQASGYTGSDPIRDGYVSLQSDGSGGAWLLYDTDARASGNTIQFRIADLEHVSSSATWAQLSGGGVSGSTVNISPGSVSHSEGNGGLTSYSFTIARSGDTSQGATTSYKVVGSGDHPADSSDVQGLGGGATFAWNPGETTRVITVNVAGDTTQESDETFSVVLQSPGAGNSNPTAVGPNATATGVIVNDDGLDTPGRTITSSREGDTLAGGAGNDTLVAGQGPDRLTGGAGADLFVFGKEPWNAGHVTDFTPGVDKLDLRGMFAHATYQGTDPVGAHVLEFRSDGAGNTQVYFDRDDTNGGDWPFLITTLDGVNPNQIGSGDFIFH